MDPRNLIPIVVEDEPTPMGRRPLNPWVVTGAGGGPYEPTGWYPSRGGNRLSPGYDGIGPSEMSRAHRTTEGLFSMSLRELQLGSLGQEDDAEIPTHPPREEDAGISVLPAGLVLLGAVVGIGLAFYIVQRETIPRR